MDHTVNYFSQKLKNWSHSTISTIAIALMLLCATAELADAKLTFRQNKHLYQAQKALNVGDAEQSITMLKSYIKEYPEEIPYQFHALLGASYHLMQNYVEAAQSFARALKLQPNSAQLSINLATCYYLADHYTQAGKQFSHSYTLSQPHNPELLYQSAIAFVQGEHYGRAKESLTTLLSSGSTIKANWYELLLSCHIELKEWNEGQKLLDLLLQQQPEHEPYWRLKAQIALQQEHYIDATAALEVSLRLKGDNKTDLTQLAQLYHYLQAPLRAAELLKRAYGTTPSAEHSLEIAHLYQQGYAYEQALDVVDKALIHAPQHQELLGFKAQLLYDQGEYQQLLGMQSEKTLPIQHLLQGYAAWHLGHWQTARTHFKHALYDSHLTSQARNALDVLNLLAEARRESETEIF